MNGARFDGVTLPYDDLIFVGAGFGVAVATATADVAGAAVGAAVPPPHAAATTAAVKKGTRNRAIRIEYLPHSGYAGIAAMVIPFDRRTRSF
jgi:hypothetical protein